MLKEKLKLLAVTALLAIGINSSALAVPIIDIAWTADPTDATETGTGFVEPDLWTYTFDVVYDVTSCDDFTEDCGLDGALLSFDPSALDFFIDVMVEIPWDADEFAFYPLVFWDDPSGGMDGIIDVFDPWAFFLPGDSFFLTVYVNVGDFSGTPWTPGFDFFLPFADDAPWDAEQEVANTKINYTPAPLLPPAPSCDDCLPPPADIAVPEPGTLALFGLGLVGLGLSRRRRKII